MGSSRDPASCQEVVLISHPHHQTNASLLEQLNGSRHGLSTPEAQKRLARLGPNALPQAKPPGLAQVFLRQFLSPLIYILLAAALVSWFLDEWLDAGFIFAVLLINAIIGTIQEYSAERSALALQNLVTTMARVARDGDIGEIPAEELVPGDIVALESGDKIPADLRLVTSNGLEIDESLLTGEALAVAKLADGLVERDAGLGDRINMAFAGTLVTRGRARGLVVNTGVDTELGHIARAAGHDAAKPPLLQRMEQFTLWVAVLVGGAAILMALIAFAQGAGLHEIFLLAVALAVSAIPEGLPVALTIALTISTHRMAKRNVIVRKLLAVEALGSCTFIASDKTGTLTVNRMTARALVLPGEEPWTIHGEGLDGAIHTAEGEVAGERAHRLCRAAALANEGVLARHPDGWKQRGDAVDTALLVMAHKHGLYREELLSQHPELDAIPFESERQYCAALHRVDERPTVLVKGALEKLLPLCATVDGPAGARAMDPAELEPRAATLAAAGYRVIALAQGHVTLDEGDRLHEKHLVDLTLLGLVGLIDPLRQEATEAVQACKNAGIEVAMVTGDHPATALAIAKDLELAREEGQVVTGPALKQALAAGAQAVDRLTRDARVFARVEPQQKLDIVQSLARQGHFVAVTGDGANDAPALRAAHVGVAMGKSGTDVARETADLIVTDDNFSSLVAGVEEGRIAYANVRKVIFLLISTGAAEIVLFTLALLSGLPIPLLAVQLLWLNLVTNGIQDVALAFEPGEGDELRKPPRAPQEAIFNRLMIERVVVSALWIGTLAFALFYYLTAIGFSEGEARNSTLLLMVLFENMHVFNSRSETRSTFRHNPMGNPLLLFGTLAAQAIHIGAMYVPGLNTVLGIEPVSFEHWLQLLLIAVSVLVVMELHKQWWRVHPAR